MFSHASGECVFRRFQSRHPLPAKAVVVLAMMLSAAAALPQSSGMPDMPGMDHSKMQMSPATDTPLRAAKRAADKRESEFNHRLAGLFLILAGVFALIEPGLKARWPVVRYGWGICFLAAGLFLFAFSDTEIWPFGRQTLWYAISHESEDLQHKIFAVMLLGLGVIHIQTARGKIRKNVLGVLFPVLAIAGSVLLLFHSHRCDMSAPNALQAMEHVKSEHARFAAVGVAIAFTSMVGERQPRWQRLCRRSWPLLLMALGVLLLAYTE